ncbi:MAG: riboflavin biosynthesis protein RibF [Planctomycetaceae bacterium]|jgi:riboflavin kinase/FMN adenylyltransferase|nr:riboflavin biosynthesis protein RibF [Planctomycetaceae bacterium]
MKLIHGTTDTSGFRGGFVSIGNFDGVHLGHKEIARKLVARARKAGTASIVMTFDPHPIQLLRPDEVPQQLSTIEDRAGWLGELGVDVLVVAPTTLEILSLEPHEFFSQVVCERFGASGLVEGEDFCFGRERSGNIESLTRLCGDSGIGLDVVSVRTVGGESVSSSRIRGLLQDGDVSGVGVLLGRNFSIRGCVEVGQRRGKQLDVPTANLGDIATVVPADGVYVGGVEVEGRRLPAAINIGGNPTFGEPARKVEVHLLAFEGDLYGQELVVEFYGRLRATRRFESAEDLRRQLADDLESVWQYIEDHPSVAVSGPESGGGPQGETGRSGGDRVS